MDGFYKLSFADDIPAYFSRNAAHSCKQCLDFKQFHYHQLKALQIYIWILYPNA